MGELITDEEIDTMIGLVDMDGDGQVYMNTLIRLLVLLHLFSLLLLLVLCSSAVRSIVRNTA
jgi:hypothetical protein